MTHEDHRDLPPYFQVIAIPSDYEELTEFRIEPATMLDDSENWIVARDTLLDIWAYLCKNREEKMKMSKTMWNYYPHLSTYAIYRTGFSKRKPDMFRVGANLYGIAQFIYEMEKWYIPYEYGVEIIKKFIYDYPVSIADIKSRENDMYARSLMIPQSARYVRQFHDPSTIHENASELVDLCRDILRTDFNTEYLFNAINESVILGFMKPSGTSWREFVIDGHKFRLAKIYMGLLITAMVIVTGGKNVDNMCCIELWGALETFIAEGCPREAVDDLVHVFQEYQAQSRGKKWHIYILEEGET